MKVLKFEADWCSPCKMLSKTIDGITDLNVAIERIDVDKDPDSAVRFRVRGVPTCVLVNDDGKEIARKVGMMTATDFVNFVNRQ